MRQPIMITVQLQECGFLFRVFAISTMLIFVALTPIKITKLLILLVIAHQEYFFWIGKGDWRRERRKGALACKVRIRG